MQPRAVAPFLHGGSHPAGAPRRKLGLDRERAGLDAANRELAVVVGFEEVRILSHAGDLQESLGQRMPVLVDHLAFQSGVRDVDLDRGEARAG
jgi:hypothetical protein